MAATLVEDGLGDPRNAAYLAIASDLAYLPAEEGAKRYRDELGLDARLLVANTTQVYVGTNAQHIVVAFRGTENPATLEGLKDWLLTDAMNLLILPQGRLGTDLAAAGVGARFHQGFVDALAGVWPELSSTVEAEMAKADRPLWITGHSLGGALAVMSAWLFTRAFVNVHQVYTFGGPMIGNVEAMKAFEADLGDRTFRYVDTNDLVPRLPAFSLLANEFVHCPTERALGAPPPDGPAAWNALTGLASQAVNGLIQGTLIDQVWKLVEARFAAHMMDNYRKKIG
ncbi:MAG: hypothetical protein KatS3mg108_2455 [Isosphaeraceae bacterium]|jgi:hypothetical protein|nr:MAG: hypothetical protein KatS3mg108_2455 [Isosphaeraceae bacterium]